MTNGVRPLEALIAEMITEWRAEAEKFMDSSLDHRADELAALLQAAAPPAPTAEPKLATLRAMMVDFKRGTQGGNQRDVDMIHKTLNVVIHEIDQLSAAPPERVSEGKETWRERLRTARLDGMETDFAEEMAHALDVDKA